MRPVTDEDVLRILQSPRKTVKGFPKRGPVEPKDAAADAVRDTAAQMQIENYEPWARTETGRFS